MAYDELLASRIRVALGALPTLEEKKMFGGVGFLVNGNLACGVHKNELIVRVGPQKHPAALSLPHTRPLAMSGRPMAGWILVAPSGFESESALKDWVDQGLAFARSLPAK